VYPPLLPLRMIYPEYDHLQWKQINGIRVRRLSRVFAPAPAFCPPPPLERLTYAVTHSKVLGTIQKYTHPERSSPPPSFFFPRKLKKWPSIACLWIDSRRRPSPRSLELFSPLLLERIFSMGNQLLRNKQDAEEVTQGRLHPGSPFGSSEFSGRFGSFRKVLPDAPIWPATLFCLVAPANGTRTVSFDAPVSAEKRHDTRDVIPAKSNLRPPEDRTVTDEFVDPCEGDGKAQRQSTARFLLLRETKKIFS